MSEDYSLILTEGLRPKKGDPGKILIKEQRVFIDVPFQVPSPFLHSEIKICT
jgi:hypothetical protein